MSIVSRFHQSGLIVLGAMVGAATASVITIAGAHGGDPTKVHGCYLTTANPGNNPPLGTVRIVKATEACKQNETALDWNGQGIAGPAGPQGPAGPPGAQGPQGPAGPSGAVPSIYYKVENGESDEDSGETFVDVSCNDNDVMIGGGGWARRDQEALSQSAPDSLATDGRTWKAYATDGPASAYVFCMVVP
jgi:hypothetical protein